MKQTNKKFLTYLFYFFIVLIICIGLVILYASYSGSCQLNKENEYTCDKDFCLYKEFYIPLEKYLTNSIHALLEKKEIQKRVTIQLYPETILNCAIPNKSGVTISTQNMQKYAPNVIEFYNNNLCAFVSSQIGLKLYPTDLNMPTSCALLIYEKEGDWINWHYDYNYYNGRFFTVLIPISHDATCTQFQFKDKDNHVVNMDLIKNAVCFEGNYLYHRASKLCKNQKRVILSCQYVTDNSMSFVNQIRIKIKDFAYTGKLF